MQGHHNTKSALSGDETYKLGPSTTFPFTGPDGEPYVRPEQPDGLTATERRAWRQAIAAQELGLRKLFAAIDDRGTGAIDAATRQKLQAHAATLLDPKPKSRSIRPAAAGKILGEPLTLRRSRHAFLFVTINHPHALDAASLTDGRGTLWMRAIAARLGSEGYVRIEHGDRSTGLHLHGLIPMSLDALHALSSLAAEGLDVHWRLANIARDALYLTKSAWASAAVTDAHREPTVDELVSAGRAYLAGLEVYRTATGKRQPPHRQMFLGPSASCRGVVVSAESRRLSEPVPVDPYEDLQLDPLSEGVNTVLDAIEDVSITNSLPYYEDKYLGRGATSHQTLTFTRLITRALGRGAAHRRRSARGAQPRRQYRAGTIPRRTVREVGVQAQEGQGQSLNARSALPVGLNRPVDLAAPLFEPPRFVQRRRDLSGHAPDLAVTVARVQPDQPSKLVGHPPQTRARTHVRTPSNGGPCPVNSLSEGPCHVPQCPNLILSGRVVLTCVLHVLKRSTLPVVVLREVPPPVLPEVPPPQPWGRSSRPELHRPQGPRVAPELAHLAHIPSPVNQSSRLQLVGQPVRVALGVPQQPGHHYRRAKHGPRCRDGPHPLSRESLEGQPMHHLQQSRGPSP